MEGELMAAGQHIVEVRTFWDNVIALALLAFVQITVWYVLNLTISKSIGRSTKDDIIDCIQNKVVGPAVVRASIHGSTAWMVTAAFSRWV